ncbi:hypothetical protein [Streptomyces sp. H39-S7]|uniref:hypothetical protein n=1 Tax=Streptomyces sp. H39-S7 TaxID=3004357 RepID=UPI0022AF2175|nr:hypothetical protein [Streptomyces sp. H39-S7]MCZ4123444.1 hypothetical protein [Streptomyces sp. H39-S7]
MAAMVAVKSLTRRAAREPSPPPATPRRLRRAVLALLLCTVALWGSLQLALTGAHTAISAAAAHTVPAIVDTSQVAYFLADADRVAAGSFASGTVALSGPGQRYQDDLKSAHQALARAAEHDATGPAGSGQLQAIEGLLVEYTSLIEQAHATAGRGVLSTAYLSYASNLMHKPDSGILAQVQLLQAADQQALSRQRHSPWLAPATLYGVLVPAAVALVLLVATQRFLSRHFHRRINPYLLAASGLLITLAGWTVVATLHSDRAFTTACDEALPSLTASWQARTLARQAAGADALAIVQTAPGQGFSHGFATYTAPLADRPVTPAVIEAARTGGPAFQGILADLLRSDLGPDSDDTARRDTALRTLQDFRRFTAADTDLQRQAAGHDFAAAATTDPAMVATAVGPGPTQLGGTGATLDMDLTRLTDLHRQRLADAEASARSDLGLQLALPVLCAAIAALCLAGLWPRIDEYRAAR